MSTKYGSKTIVHYPLSIIHYVATTIVVLLSLSAATSAAEIRLRSEASRCTEMLVVLGDVADIIPAAGDDVVRLRQTVLTTAPAPGEEKTLQDAEIRDILSRSGVSSLQHRLTGAAKITLVGNGDTNRSKNNPIAQASYVYETTTPPAIQTTSAVEPTRPNTLRRMPVSPQLVRTLEQQLGEAIGVYLNHRNSTETGNTEKLPWKVIVKLSQEQGRQLASSGQIVDIFGSTGAGPQRFGIRMQAMDPTTGQNVVVTVDAVVSLPQEVVVVRRALPKGFIIGPNDVMMRRVDDLKSESFFVDMKEVIGRETVRAVNETGVLEPSMLRKPTWVRKGDIVTIRAKNAGITVRTEVTALADGCEGDMIPVETINPNAAKRGRRTASDSTSFLARVCDPKTVEVYASGNVIN